MTLRPNARSVLRHSRTVHWAIVSGVMSGAQLVLPLFITNTPLAIFAALALAASAASIIFRAMRNNKTDPPK